MKTGRSAMQTVVWLAFMLTTGGTQVAARDAVKEVNEHNAKVSTEERAFKFGKMAASPFAFYRATAHLFYHDIAGRRLRGPAAWEGRQPLQTWISGDYHLQNVGTESIGGVHRRFELNDFDESCRAPFHWDLLRFVSSLYLVQNSHAWKVDEEDRLRFRLGLFETDRLAEIFIDAYRQAIDANNVVPSLSGIEMLRPTALHKPAAVSASSFVRSTLTLSPQKVAEKNAEFWTAKRNDVPDKTRFNVSQTILNKDGRLNLYVTTPEPLLRDIQRQWDDYLASLSPDFVAREGRGYFRILDHAKRLKSGLGSAGVTKIYLLLEGPTTRADDNIIVEAKECTTPAPVAAGALPAPRPSTSHGRRVSDATRLMTFRIDPMEGCFNAGGCSFHVTRMHPLFGGSELGDFASIADLRDYVYWAGAALGNAHCRSDGHFAKAAQALLATAPETSTRELQQACRRYAARVIADHQAFVASKVEAPPSP